MNYALINAVEGDHDIIRKISFWTVCCELYHASHSYKAQQLRYQHQVISPLMEATLLDSYLPKSLSFILPPFLHDCSDGNTNCETITAKVSSGSLKNVSMGHEFVFGTVATPTSLHGRGTVTRQRREPAFVWTRLGTVSVSRMQQPYLPNPLASRRLPWPFRRLPCTCSVVRLVTTCKGGACMTQHADS